MYTFVDNATTSTNVDIVVRHMRHRRPEKWDLRDEAGRASGAPPRRFDNSIATAIRLRERQWRVVDPHRLRHLAAAARVSPSPLRNRVVQLRACLLSTCACLGVEGVVQLAVPFMPGEIPLSVRARDRRLDPSGHDRGRTAAPVLRAGPARTYLLAPTSCWLRHHRGLLDRPRRRGDVRRNVALRPVGRRPVGRLPPGERAVPIPARRPGDRRPIRPPAPAAYAHHPSGPGRSPADRRVVRSLLRARSRRQA